MSTTADPPPQSENTFRIGVVDDHETSVIGLSAMISGTADLTFAGGAGTVDELLAITTDLDLAVLDLRLGDGTSPRGNVEKLRAHGVEALVYTSAEEAFLVRSAAAAGVLGVVRKSTRATEVLDAIRAAARGEQVATMDWAAAIDADADFVDVNLSPRQRQVLELYAAGEPAARVASVTGLSGDTVNQYLGRIRQKYAAAGRPAPTKTDLYKRAVEDGWLPMPRRFRH
ncbi:response regulator transcription factor [Williamsia phyllosphaerae]|uniref:DNA-binding response regulator n=1 Tax=Williamsia phyllosphaerae TaxID=885042 RepID=A0ABQ1UMT4_9NOCA|nr:response regulator transcription factor [Williamsia phyllosphaerae]GGF22751.1 DNA-binding response regulator [Williamsia phyllosphaerae]